MAGRRGRERIQGVGSGGSPRDAQRQQLGSMLFLILGLGIALSAIALLLLQASATTGTRIASGIVGALAGGLIGASISNFVNRQYDRPVLDEIQDLLLRTSSSSVTSPEADLQHLRRLWHHYHLTFSEGQPVWRYSLTRFDNHSAIGALTADVPVMDILAGRPPHIYKTTGAVWDRRLVLLQTRIEGDEAAFVGIFPDVSGFQPVHAGVAIMQSWSGDDVLAPTLISSSPLLLEQDEGSIVDVESTQALHSLWQEHFGRVRRLLPEPSPVSKRALG